MYQEKSHKTEVSQEETGEMSSSNAPWNLDTKVVSREIRNQGDAMANNTFHYLKSAYSLNIDIKHVTMALKEIEIYKKTAHK